MDAKNNFLMKNLSESMEDAEWFLKYRDQAFSQINKLSAPKIERLNYTEWNLFEKPDFVVENEATNPRQQIKDEVNIDFIQRSSGNLEGISNEDSEIFVSSFKELFQTNNEKFEHLYKQSEFIHFKDKFNAFNLAYLTSGVFIYIPKEIEVKEPIHLTFLNEESAHRNKNHQVFIYAEANSTVEIIESYYSVENQEETSKVNVHVHIQADRGAKIKYTSIDELDENTQAFFRRTGRTGDDSRVDLALGVMSDGNIIEDIQMDLIGAGSSGDIKAVAISRKNQTQVINTKVTNHGAHTVGNIYQHGVVLDQATLTFNGVGDVLKNAKNSDAQQESRILILSEEARADTNPILLIDEYELTAGHAASISRVDDMQLYYLMSRGLGRTEAERLVIRGFLGSVLMAISVEEIRNNLIETIERKLSVL